MEVVKQETVKNIYGENIIFKCSSIIQDECSFCNGNCPGFSLEAQGGDCPKKSSNLLVEFSVTKLFSKSRTMAFGLVQIFFVLFFSVYLFYIGFADEDDWTLSSIIEDHKTKLAIVVFLGFVIFSLLSNFFEVISGT